MTVAFALPDVGEGLHEAEIIQWLVAEGETVARDQPIVEILTDKAQIELPSPAAGVISRLSVSVGDIVAVGTVLVEIDGPGGASASAGAAAAAPVAAGPPPTAPPPSSTPAQRPAGQRAKASPATRKLAVSLGVDLAGVAGTGPGGRVTADDVRALASQPAPTAAPAFAPAPGPVAPSFLNASAPSTPPPLDTSQLGQLAAGTHPLRGIRRLTAAAMAQSWSTIPHITGMDEVDASALLEARRALRDRAGDQGGVLTPLVLLAMAVARALRRFPLVNASVSDDGGAVTVYPDVNLGVAVATPDGLIVPVVTQADRRGPRSMAAEMARLAAAARARTVTPGELRGGTFTITNYGALGGRLATPLILPGQAGIMGFGAIRERPLVVDGAVVARPTLPVVFSADHRIIDGDLSVAFQEFVIALIANPIALLLEP